MTSAPNPVRTLNDAFRAAGPMAGDWVITPGVSALGETDLLTLISAVRKFSAFTEDNDPYGEHDFGSLVQSGEKIFWKIDYYDPTLRAGSEDPSDVAATRRVMTIMLASEY